ncbi:ATP synthase delta chain, chloroplastic [Phoenix dactylifera]|uniref:ATP synthase delta chain, chloroplastic n=1 Tax=Phoenix dactylifera TaxID=42345 RepID=A0A8B8ZJ97_PHODC|nr:ATP synthase delta chain, chloroplastic [Phoenix dactylifera]
MDALSTPVSSLRPGAFLSTPHPRDLPNLLKPHPSSHLLPNLSAKPKPPSQSLSLDPHKPLPHLSLSSPPRPHPLSKPSTHVHRRTATGYAAALVDAARCDGALDAVDRDARRLLHAVSEKEEKGEAVTAAAAAAAAAAAEGGGFYKHVVALVRMLVRKGKAGMVREVMAEVRRICDELSGTQVVVVSSQRKMEEAELQGIAREVARVSGAAKVKVRHVFAV